MPNKSNTSILNLEFSVKKRGRPPLDESEAKTARIIFAATEAEKESYASHAGLAGITLAEWIRDSLNAEIKRETRQKSRIT